MNSEEARKQNASEIDFDARSVQWAIRSKVNTQTSRKCTINPFNSQSPVMIETYFSKNIAVKLRGRGVKEYVKRYRIEVQKS